MALPAALLGQGNYATNGGEYAIVGTLPGDQVYPQLSLNASGGFLVWQDNITDGDGLGISAVRLDSSFSAPFAPFRVNSTTTDDQERPALSLLNGGGAAFVWQGGKAGYQHIYARFLSASNTWLTGDVLVNSATNCSQFYPAITTLQGGSVVAVYGSMNQQGSNSLQDVFGQVLSPAGQKIGSEFLVNQFTPFNQRSASVTALQNGGFVVLWVSEQERSGNVDSPGADYVYGPTNRASVDIYARLYNASGSPVTGEILVNATYDVCASPRVACGSDGGFMVTWAQKSYANLPTGWDIFARPFSSAGVGGSVVPVNSYLYGDQYTPQIAALGTDYFVLWTSLGQDGSREGVFGQFLRSTGAPAGSEIRINTKTIGQQMHPCVASDGNGRFLAVWTSFVGGVGSFDLFAQRWVNVAQPLLPMDPPYVFVPFVITGTGTNAAYQPQLQVSWPFLAGLAVDHYEVYVDGSPTPAASLTNNVWLMTAANGLTPNSTHTFQVAYVAADGRRSPLSAASSGTTWNGSRLMIYGGSLPAEWVAQYYGFGTAWPPANSPLVPGGPTLLQVFLSGGSPLDPTSWLRTSVVHTPQGYFLTWNPQPGLIYQVQTSLDLNALGNLGAPGFAAGTADSIFIGGNNMAYYRVLLQR